MIKQQKLLSIRYTHIAILVWGITLALRGGLHADLPKQSEPIISKVGIDKDIFNPKEQGRIKISFNLSKKAEVTIKIFSSDHDLINTICYERTMEKGTNVVSWNGCDQQQKIVPDEAYFFTIEAQCGSQKEMYDPTSFSGGFSHEIDGVKILSQKQEVEYFLSEKGRVFMRAGLHKGPLLAILVDWEPRPKGWNRETWNGVDQDRLISVLNNPLYRIRTSYFSLPENAIITRGNQDKDYFDYRKLQKEPVNKKVFPPSSLNSILISPLSNAGLVFTKSPPLEISFLQATVEETGIFVVEDKIRIKINFTQNWSAPLRQQEYEIYFFLNGQFLREDPSIHLPYEATLELGEYPPGTYILSVNIFSPKGQVGIKSKNVKLR